MTSTITNIRARRAEIAQLMEALEQEDDELEMAEKVVARLEANPKTNGSAVTTTKANGALTQRDMIVGILRTRDNPWVESSKTLHTEIHKLYGVKITPGSFLPMLSYLKKKDVIVRAGPKIALAERVGDQH
jgi:hypothetical protein